MTLQEKLQAALDNANELEGCKQELQIKLADTEYKLNLFMQLCKDTQELLNISERAAERRNKIEALVGGWHPIETAPRDGTPILGWCVHSENAYVEENGSLTTYGAHAEGLGRVTDGPHVLVWGGEYKEEGWEDYPGVHIPDWWFRAGSDFEEAANPTRWMYIPEQHIETQE